MDLQGNFMSFLYLFVIENQDDNQDDAKTF